MPIYQVACADAKLTMDTDKDSITITRSSRYQLNLPSVTEIKLSEVTAIEYEYLTYGIEAKGTGAIKFQYPGCPQGGDLLMGFATHENIVQYKAPSKADANKFIEALKPIVEQNKARLAP